jgi:nicotinamidase-related amidase
MEQSTRHTGLFVMDMQTAILRNLPETSNLINKVAGAIALARVNKIPVIFITVGFRPGAPEINSNNKGLRASRERFISGNMEEFVKIEPAVAPADGEIVICKRRVSAFSGSDLEVILRSLGIQHMVLSGIATSGVVLSTVREAADKDYRLTVLSDACADADPEVHQVLTTKIFPRQADVMTVEAWRKLVESV